MRPKQYYLFVLAALLLGGCQKSDPSGPWFGNGIHNGWADQNSVVIWTRLTQNPEMNYGGTPFTPLTMKDRERLDTLAIKDSIMSAQIPEGLELEDMEGACPGMDGEVRLSYYPLGLESNMITTAWEQVDPDRNYTRQWHLDGLSAGTVYELIIESRNIGDDKVFATARGNFETAPEPGSLDDVKFCVVTCHDYIRRDDSLGGHRIYPAMEAINPDFFIHTGDIEYYDKENPWSMTEELMRFKWDRLFALPYQRDFYASHTCYFMKDDHDALRDDCHPGDYYGTVSFERGLEIFDKEQFPSDEKRYKTVRWGRDLQFWIMEGRNYRSKNHIPDGPEKTIWGKEQKEWLFRTLEESDATFRIVVSPTPIIGPDRLNKNDNYSNAGFKTEGDEIRDFINHQKNVFLVNGDRHWQYVSHPEGTNLWEFSTGAGADMHAGGWSQEDVRPEHRFLRVKGGFLLGEVIHRDEETILRFTHCDVDGRTVHTEEFFN
jgi:alkaline phosphatase D